MKNTCNLFSFNDDKFNIYLNDKKITLPLFYAAAFSSTISKLLSDDNTIRDYKIGIDFRNMKSEEVITKILTSNDPVSHVSFDTNEEIYDLAEFGEKFGNEEFIKPLIALMDKQEKEGINNGNALSNIIGKCILSHIDNRKIECDQELSYISEHFSYFCKNESFKEWSIKEGNEDILERIIQSERLHIEKKR